MTPQVAIRPCRVEECEGIGLYREKRQEFRKKEAIAPDFSGPTYALLPDGLNRPGQLYRSTKFIFVWLDGRRTSDGEGLGCAGG